MQDNQDSPKVGTKIKIDAIRRAEIGREKRARTRAVILNAAFEALGHVQGRSTPIEAICVKSGIARPTFYRHFSGVDELFEALSYELSNDFNSAVTRILSDMPTAAERIAAATRYYLERATADPQWGWAMVHLSAGGPIFGLDTFLRAQADIEFGIQQGEFILPGPDSGRDLILGTGLAAMITQLRDSPPVDFPRNIAKHVLLGLGVSSRRANDIVASSLPKVETKRRAGS